MYDMLWDVFMEVFIWCEAVAANLFHMDKGWFGPLFPYFLIGIAVSLVFVSVKLIRKFVWGN